ncbi:hypothetical protein ACGFX4_25960 [Kitasatospora sp. NPDC048365]|uniref:hypothetical protein n=1 Tax=Kitasatospora sp. NPDC048365 TaxID=3364050 RepID=UPI0037187CEF
MTSMIERLHDHTLTDLAALAAPHDSGHLARTAELAGRIAEESGLAAGTARCAAYLYHRFGLPDAPHGPAGPDGPVAPSRADAVDFLSRSGVPDALHRDLLTLLDPDPPAAEVPYGAAVLDAERIDAMGAAGLHRTLAGGGPRWHAPAGRHPRPALPELYEALVRTERELLTEPARRLAADRMDLVHRLAADYRAEAELGRHPAEAGPAPTAAPGVSWDPKSGFLHAATGGPAAGPLVRIGYRGTVWLTFDDRDRLLGIDLYDAPAALVAVLPPGQQHRYFWHSTARGAGMAWWADPATCHVWITTAPGLAHHRVVGAADIEVGTRADRPAILRLHVQANR